MAHDTNRLWRSLLGSAFHRLFSVCSFFSSHVLLWVYFGVAQRVFYSPTPLKKPRSDRIRLPQAICRVRALLRYLFLRNPGLLFLLFVSRVSCTYLQKTIGLFHESDNAKHNTGCPPWGICWEMCNRPSLSATMLECARCGFIWFYSPFLMMTAVFFWNLYQTMILVKNTW